MAVSNPRTGAPIDISRGRKGERGDIYPARITGEAVVAYKGGRPQMLVPIVALQVSRAGDEYLAADLFNLAFAFDRSERCIALDGPSTQPKTVQELVAEANAAARAHLMTLPESNAVQAVDELGI